MNTQTTSALSVVVTDVDHIEWYAIPLMASGAYIEDEDTNDLLTAMLSSMCEYVDCVRCEIGEVASNMLHTTSWTHP